MKSVWVSDLQDIGPVQGVFLVADAEVRMTRDDNPFLRLKLQDKTGAIDAVRWKASDKDQQLALNVAHILINGRLDMYQGHLQITIDRMSPPPGDVNLADFLPVSRQEPACMLEDLGQLVKSISEPQLRRLLEHITGATEIGRKFAQAPAATTVHHAYLSGLLEHTLSVTQIADVMASHYPNINRDLLIAGAVLHDIGKIEEYEWQVRFKQSDSGGLIGHIVQGAMLVNRLMDSVGDFDSEMRMLLTHMIVSHHGQLEYGSPKVPMCKEAIILHYIEDLDAKMQIADNELANPLSQGSSPNWTKRNNWLGCALFRSGPEEPDKETPFDRPHTETPGKYDDPFAEQG